MADSASILTYVSCGCAVVSTACALFIARRGGQWRETDDAKAARTGHLQRTDDLESRMDKLEPKVDALATSIAGLPTEADIARLEGKIGAVDAVCRAAAAGVLRIESFMMKGGS